MPVYLPHNGALESSSQNSAVHMSQMSQAENMEKNEEHDIYISELIKLLKEKHGTHNKKIWTV